MSLTLRALAISGACLLLDACLFQAKEDSSPGKPQVQDTTKVPIDTTKVPGDTTKVPIDTAKVPGDTTKVPVDTAKGSLGLSILLDTAQGIARVTWNRSGTAGASYALYRNSPFRSENLILVGSTSDTALADTVFRTAPGGWMLRGAGTADHADSLIPDSDPGDAPFHAVLRYTVFLKASGDSTALLHQGRDTLPAPNSVRTYLTVTLVDRDGMGLIRDGNGGLRTLVNLSIKDTLYYVARARNTYRTVNVAWTLRLDGGTGTTYVRRDYASHEALDSLRYVLPAEPGHSVHLAPTDPEGTGGGPVSLPTLMTVLDVPFVWAGPDAYKSHGDSTIFVGDASDDYGMIVKFELDSGATGNFRELAYGGARAWVVDEKGHGHYTRRVFRPFMLPVGQDSLICVFRATDDDGLQAQDTIIYRLGPPLLPKGVRKADMPTPRRAPTALALGGKVYALAGVTAATSPVEEYDPSTDSWRNVLDLPDSLQFLGADTLPGRIVCMMRSKTWTPVIEGSSSKSLRYYFYTIDPTTGAVELSPHSAEHYLMSHDLVSLGILDSVFYAVNRAVINRRYDIVQGYHIRDGSLVYGAPANAGIGIQPYVSAEAFGGNWFILSHVKESYKDNEPYLVRINPSTDSNLSMMSRPEAFGGRPQIARHGKRLYFFGVWTDPTASIGNLVYTYDMEKDLWAFASQTTVTRSQSGTAVIGNKAYIVGGLTNPVTGHGTGILEEYPLDP